MTLPVSQTLDSLGQENNVSSSFLQVYNLSNNYSELFGFPAFTNDPFFWGNQKNQIFPNSYPKRVPKLS